MTMAKLSRSTCFTLATLASVCLSSLVASCGGGGGGATAVSGGLPEFNGKCTAGIVRGFTGAFDDKPVRVINTGDGEGGGGGSGGSGGSGAGAGGDGAGAPGIGVGGALGQFVNVDVSAQFASGESFGPVRVDNDKGMVTVVPCGLKPPVLVTMTGTPGAGAQYFDEAIGRNVSFEGQTLRTVITAFDKNAGVTSFTEAMVQRTERLAGGASTTGATTDAWKDAQRVESAHGDVRAAVNDLLPGDLRLQDLRRLPVILSSRNFVAGSTVLSDDQNGRYGAALAGFAQTGGAHLGDTQSPALEINRQFAADMADGRIDLVDAGRPVIGNAGAAYTVNAFWSNQTLQTTQAARFAGSGTLRDALVPLASMRASLALGGQQLASIDARHFSDGTLRYNLTTADCPGRTISLSFARVRQFANSLAISQDGLTYYSIGESNKGDPCAPQLEIPFDVPGVRMVWISAVGSMVRGSDGALYFRVPGRWVKVVLDGPRQNQVDLNQEFIWGIGEAGELYRHADANNVADPAIQAIRTTKAINVVLPAPVVLIATTEDRREIFALTSTNELYWLDGRNANGVRAPDFVPRPVKLDVGKVCWISSGLVAVACDGQSHRTIKAISDLAAPPIVRNEDPNFGLTLVPGVKGLQISAPVTAATPIWRSTDGLGRGEGVVTPIADYVQPALLVGVDGSLRTLDGQLVPAAR